MEQIILFIYSSLYFLRLSNVFNEIVLIGVFMF